MPLAPPHRNVSGMPVGRRLLVSSVAEPKAWIVDGADMTAIGEIELEGEARLRLVLPGPR